MRPSFTLGIEEEYQTIDPVTRDLRSHIATEMLAQGKMRLEERVKAEMHQSVIEVGTSICRDYRRGARGSVQAAARNDPPGPESTTSFSSPAPPIPLPTGGPRRSTPIRVTTRS